MSWLLACQSGPLSYYPEIQNEDQLRMETCWSFALRRGMYASAELLVGICEQTDRRMTLVVAGRDAFSVSV